MLMLITELQNSACCYDTCSDGVLPAVGAAASTLAFETLLSTECWLLLRWTSEALYTGGQK